MKNYKPDDQCPIWCTEFLPEQNIIHLPCNSKHIFHAQCIGEWISTNPTWPLWKMPITQELCKEFEENDKDTTQPDGEDLRELEFRRIQQIEP